MNFSYRFLSQISSSLNGNRLELTKSQRKQLDTLGHVWTKYFAAQDLLLKKATKSQLDPRIQPWVEGLSQCEGGITTTTLEQGFVLVAQSSGSLEAGIEVFGAMTEPDALRGAVETLLKIDEEGARLPFSANIPEWRNAPVWSALLRLNELKQFWIQELRQNHYDSLTRWLPDAWLLLDEKLPPGAVIARLPYATWETTLKSEPSFYTCFARAFRDLEALTEAHLQDHASPRVVIRLNEGLNKPLFLYFSHQNGKTHFIEGIEIYEDS